MSRSVSGHPRFQIKDHAPEAVDFAALDDFQRFQFAEGGIRRLQPLRDGVPADNLGEPLLEALHFFDLAQARRGTGLKLCTNFRH